MPGTPTSTLTLLQTLQAEGVPAYMTPRLEHFVRNVLEQQSRPTPSQGRVQSEVPERQRLLHCWQRWPMWAASPGAVPLRS